MQYTVETVYPYQFFHCSTKKEAMETMGKLKKQGVRAHIVCMDENGNDYILA